MQPHFTDEFRKSQRLSETFLQRFWAKVQKTEGCWLWTAGITGRGYGKLGRGAAGDGQVNAHVASWLIHNGAIPEGIFVCHECDTILCVRPSHLFLGTHDDNMRDMVLKGRSCTGEKNGVSILTEESVLTIRELHATTIPNQRELSRMFGVNFRTINYIVHRKLWSHI